MDFKRIILATVGLALLAPLLAASNAASKVLSLSYLGRKDLPLGMRNNNPGNIRVSQNPWKGKLKGGGGGGFEQFVSYVYGIRAMIRQLLTYQSRGWNTIEKIVSKWAPPEDNNDTQGYIRFVSARTGIPEGSPLNLYNKAQMSAIVRAMAQMENYGGNESKEAVTLEQFNAAWGIADI